MLNISMCSCEDSAAVFNGVVTPESAVLDVIINYDRNVFDSNRVFKCIVYEFNLCSDAASAYPSRADDCQTL